MAASPPNRKRRLAAAEAEAEPELSPPDALGALPVEVLDNILGRLHIYDVVRTSALSRAWRRRWESLPTVDLTRSPGVAASDVDAVLLRRSAPVRAFRLAARDPSWFVDALHDWLLYLSRSGVQALYLWFPTPSFRLHSCLFSCRELTSLDLEGCRLPPAPSGFEGFQNLKKLHLTKVSLPEHGDKALAALFAGSPLLEDVELMNALLVGDGADEWVIRAPNLRKLIMVAPFPYAGRVEDLPRLEEGILCGPNYAKFLTGMAHVTKLEFVCSFMRGQGDDAQDIDANDEFLNAQSTNDMFAKLHVVRMKKVACLCNEMHFMEFVLNKAGVLRVLSVYPSSGSTCSNEQTIITEHPRVSPDAQVIFMNRESANNGYMHTSSVNYELETIRSGTWLDVEHPRKIHRLDLDAVDQQKQLEKVLLQTQKEGKKRNEEAQARHEDTKRRLKFCVAANEYFTSALKSRRLPNLADKVQEDSRVDHDVVGAASVRANSPEPEDHL
uniref:F-box protein family-like protein n=1 Tax=Oryza sativa subsp. japonica TaxID=39947 RepID=Q6Z954_ORYSJ|nr:F-box protein family-like protein [Oryza sativa Japonica Group]